MAWTGLVLTVDGQDTLNKAQLSNKMKIKSIVVGDGNAPANFRTLKSLVHQLYEITDMKVDVEGGKCTLTADIPQMNYDYYFREIGIMVTTEEDEILYAYDNCSDSAQYIVSTTGVETTRKRIRLVLNISDVAEITVVDSGILYVAYDEYEETVMQLKNDIQSNTKNMEDHLADKENPHEVTVEQLHLENVDNTGDMEKPVSTAQQAALDELYQQLTAYTLQKIADMIDGAPESMNTLKEVHDAIAVNQTIMDALDAAIGKKASAAEFDSHVKDTEKHITVAEREAWTAKLATNGNASNVTATFSPSSSRANLTSNEKLSVSLGKIMKWLADLANGAASTLLGSNLTANRALMADANGKVAASTVTATELGYLAGVTSNVQNQLDALNTGIGNTGIRYNLENDKVQLYNGTTWIDWKDGNISYKEHVYSQSTSGANASIIFQKISGGNITETKSIPYHPNPDFSGSLISVSYTGNNWYVTAIKNLKYSTYEDMTNSATLNAGQNITWNYSQSVSYYFMGL